MNGHPTANGRPGIFGTSKEPTGLPIEDAAPVCEAALAAMCPPLPAWITENLLACTQDVWSRHLGRPIPQEEAVEMLLNVKRLAEVLLKAERAEGESR